MGEIIEIVIKNIEERPYKKVIVNSLETMQEIVGGYIEFFQIRHDILLVINEEGKINGLDENFAIISFPNNRESILHDIICGNGFFVSSKGEEFESLNEEQERFIHSSFNLDGTLFIMEKEEGEYNG